MSMKAAKFILTMRQYVKNDLNKYLKAGMNHNLAQIKAGQDYLNILETALHIKKSEIPEELDFNDEEQIRQFIEGLFQQIESLERYIKQEIGDLPENVHLTKSASRSSTPRPLSDISWNELIKSKFAKDKRNELLKDYGTQKFTAGVDLSKVSWDDLTKAVASVDRNFAVGAGFNFLTKSATTIEPPKVIDVHADDRDPSFLLKEKAAQERRGIDTTPTDPRDVDIMPRAIYKKKRDR